MIPILIGIIKKKNLMDDPNSRSSHKIQTPTLGGFVFFVVLMMCMFFLSMYDNEAIGRHIIPALTILFFVGLKDDLMVLDPKKKILAQLAAITLLVLHTSLIPVHFYGFLGFEEVPLWLGVGFSYFTVLCIINAYNLIDGIDGLAALVGMVIFGFFALVFYKLDLFYYASLAAVCLGFLIAFLRFNLSNTDKIFMGDTGSMIIGFLIGLMTLRFLSIDTLQLAKINIVPENLFYVILAILFVMLIDTLRVFIIRLLNNKGPFSPDRNHVHHILIDFGWSHIKASVFIALVNVFMIWLILTLNESLTDIQLLAVFCIVSILVVLILFVMNTNYSALRQKLKIRSFIFSEKKIDRYKTKLNTGNIAWIFRMFF